MLEQEIKALIQEFKTAIYGKDVRKTYADIAELVCVRAMQDLDQAIDHAEEQGNRAEAQGNYAEEQGNRAEAQGNYAEEQGDYAKAQGDYAEQQTADALAEIHSTMLQVGRDFSDMQDTLASAETGALLIEINRILSMHRLATETDIDKIIAETYVDSDNDGGIFEAGSTQDIDDIIDGTYVDAA